ncbi:Type 1 glutamine amidotransferase-like domain-containing protein [Streptomyces sp. NPDC093589]|uniref:Type 1 glutamine amidotransferase-like domain-containing protein n=1 Tax=Streptomyces sp. NPDC093589 TaxID=3366043 RepID=UPI003813E768
MSLVRRERQESSTPTPWRCAQPPYPSSPSAIRRAAGWRRPGPLAMQSAQEVRGLADAAAAKSRRHHLLRVPAAGIPRKLRSSVRCTNSLSAGLPERLREVPSSGHDQRSANLPRRRWRRPPGGRPGLRHGRPCGRRRPGAVSPVREGTATPAWVQGMVRGGVRRIFAEVITPEDPSQALVSEGDFGAVYLGGGDTGRLLDTLRSAGLEGLIARHMSRGGLLCGGSAGAIVCGATILTAPPEEHSPRGNDGLNLLGGASVLAHYEGTAAARAGALGLAAELRANALWALPENSGIHLGADGTPRSLGERPCLQFTASGRVSAIPPAAV